MTGDVERIILLKTLQGGGVLFWNCEKGYILGISRIGKLLEYSIENIYYMNRLKFSLLRVSQICDKGNKVNFHTKNYCYQSGFRRSDSCCKNGEEHVYG